MKKLTILFILLTCFLPDLFAQTGGSQVSFEDVPIDLYLFIGFLFVYILLGLLFLMIFIFYPRQRLNLFFSLYNICLVALMMNTAFPANGYGLIAGNLIDRLIGANILLFILYALDQPKRFFWWFISFIVFVDYPLTIILKEKYLFIAGFFQGVFAFMCLVLAVIAFRNKKTANWLIGLIALAVVFINLRVILLIFANFELGSGIINYITPFVITLCAVVYLALRYGRINTSLEQQLEQVQVLSQKNLQAEKEKQQILADQNENLEQQVTKRTLELNNSITELRSAQAQLIQSEKMASLGELTAGIAHEIQNPLNFVNNFSEVNKELLAELNEEIGKGNYEGAKLIAADITDNEEKISHHGKRADSIVKGMLQHSHSSSTVKEPTDINSLADEYLRLAYHGLRAKDKNFNATLKTDFDDSIGRVNVIPQDIGRLLLNLFNNAFWAVNETQKSTNGRDSMHGVSGTGEYSPQVSVTTKKIGNQVQITVKDNGNGIPEKIVDKIFQPFFTTKPTGQGTGLGLSLAYDIVKAHSGELKVNSIEGQGSEFQITLNSNA